MRVGIIGAGISGIATARVLAHLGHEVTVFERDAGVGGIWQRAYPGVRLQNTASQYRLTDFDWPFEPDLHPTREQVIAYLEAAVARFDVDVRLGHDIVAMRPRGGAGWTLDTGVDGSHDVDLAILAVGQFSGPPIELDVPGRDTFAGRILTDRDLEDMDAVANRRVVVVGFGKSAVDLATFAADRGSRVHHVFREARWMLPRTMLGIHLADIVFSRSVTMFTPAWVHPGRLERKLHDAAWLVDAYWRMAAAVFRARHGLHRGHLSAGARARLESLVPDQPITKQMRSAIPLAPDGYYRHVRKGRIEPRCATVAALEADAVVLSDGTRLACDALVPALGTPAPTFPYLPAEHRALLEAEPDGPQLYRHIVHPRIPRLAFAGYNHSFMHVPCVESAALWLDAVYRNDLELPGCVEMESTIAAILQWKRDHSLFEPARSCAVNLRFQQYQDAMLSELGLRVRRKGHALREAFSAYGPADYDGVLDEYARTRTRRRSCAFTT